MKWWELVAAQMAHTENKECQIWVSVDEKAYNIADVRYIPEINTIILEAE